MQEREQRKEPNKQTSGRPNKKRDNFFLKVKEKRKRKFEMENDKNQW